MRGLAKVLLMVVAILCAAMVWGQSEQQRRERRRINPINTNATATQSINETRNDTSRINAAIRARSTSFVREDGAIVYIDTVSGSEWIDSATIRRGTRMTYPRWTALSVGVDLWDPVMRLFGQKYGVVGFWANVSVYNRFFPTFEMGLGMAKDTPADMNYTYRTPMSPYFKIGCDYNFLFNSNSDYKFFAGLRYGFAPFKWEVSDITLNSGYWGESTALAIPSQSGTAGWLEFCLGLQVRLWSNISAGWTLRYHSILHESKNVHGEPWYIPGYGARGNSLTGSFSVSYTLPVQRKAAPADAEILPDDEPAPTPQDTTAIN